jgi:hypothetical protein
MWDENMWLISEIKNVANDAVPTIRICSFVYLWTTFRSDDKLQVSYSYANFGIKKNEFRCFLLSFINLSVTMAFGVKVVLANPVKKAKIHPKIKENLVPS